MIALTRLPSGRRASTIGEASSTRRPTCETILSMIRITCESSTKRTSVRSSLPSRSTYTWSEPLTMTSVTESSREQRLDRAVAEDVVGQLADDLAALVARQRRAVERELLRDGAVDLVGEVARAVLLEELRPELRDALVVDAAFSSAYGSSASRRRRTRALPLRTTASVAAVALASRAGREGPSSAPRQAQAALACARFAASARSLITALRERGHRLREVGARAPRAPPGCPG